MQPCKIAAAALTTLALSTTPAFAQKHGQQEQHQAKVKIEDARKIALTKVPGTIKHEELENEHHRWIFSFEITPEGQKKDNKTIKEVNIDADTGEVVSVATEKD